MNKRLTLDLQARCGNYHVRVDALEQKGVVVVCVGACLGLGLWSWSVDIRAHPPQQSLLFLTVEAVTDHGQGKSSTA